MNNFYRLENKVPVACDMIEWARWFEANPDARVVAQHDGPTGVSISTVFLGLDHSWGGGPPLLFETMIFGGPHDGYQERCSTWAEAEGQHSQAMKLAKRGAEVE